MYTRHYSAFTLVELLVSMTIMMILTGVLLYKYPDSSIRINLLNFSHGLALSMREAQVRGSAIDSLQGLYSGYGLHFTTANPGSYIFFADIASAVGANGITIGDGLFSSSPVDETESTIRFPDRYSIKKICIGTSHPFTCNASNTPVITALTISFTRPSPEPNIYINNSKVASQPISGACIELWSPKGPEVGHIRTVEVLGAGLISTSKKPCESL